MEILNGGKEGEKIKIKDRYIVGEASTHSLHLLEGINHAAIPRAESCEGDGLYVSNGGTNGIGHESPEDESP